MTSTTDAPNSGGTPAGVVETKLLAPTPRPEQVPRPRLIALLEAGSDRKLTLLGAPVGYGKTTLLTQWLRSRESDLPYAWVSLDEQDNDPVRLWRHVVEALRRATRKEALGAEAVVGLGVVGVNPVETALPSLVNELAGLPRKVVLVLDDYHYVTNGDCHETVAFFVEHLPETVQLVVSSRSRPALGLGRLRARGQTNEVGTDELAFSEEDAASLLEKLALGIGRADVEVLVERTEGWPAAIYLAALSMAGKDAHAFVESLKGSSRYIADLLAEDVLATFSEERMDFLLKTSVLEKMSGPLCDEVAGVEGSGGLLRDLERSNLFVVPLHEEGEWCRYHQLFSDFLLYELKNTHPNLVPILHGRASAWFEREGQLEEAVRHAIAAGEHERAGQLVAGHWYGYVFTGQSRTVERWLDSLPEGLISRDAALLLVRAWICILSGRGGEAEGLLSLVEGIPHEGPLPDGTASVEVGVAIVRAVFGLGGVGSVLEAARRAAELEPEPTSPRAALIRFGLGATLYLSGEAPQSRRRLEETLEFAGAAQPVMRMSALSVLAVVLADEGHLKEALSRAREARALVERFGLQDLPQSSWAVIALGHVLARRGDASEAEAELERGLSARRKLPGLSPWPTLIGLLALAPVRSERGDRSGAREVLAEAQTLMERYPDAGILRENLERQERKLRRSKRRDGASVEELTERELAVLGLLDGDLTAGQIGQRLYVATSTVRTHIKSLHRKLGASSREEVLSRARARGLL